jgi:hypothetical protein
MVMWFLLGLGCAILAVLIFLVQPNPPTPVETVDTVAECVEKYWRGKPIEKWPNADDMDPVCRSIMNKAMEAN